MDWWQPEDAEVVARARVRVRRRVMVTVRVRLRGLLLKRHVWGRRQVYASQPCS